MEFHRPCATLTTKHKQIQSKGTCVDYGWCKLENKKFCNSIFHKINANSIIKYWCAMLIMDFDCTKS